MCELWSLGIFVFLFLVGIWANFASVLFRDGAAGGFRRRQLFVVYGARGDSVLSVKSGLPFGVVVAEVRDV